MWTFHSLQNLDVFEQEEVTTQITPLYLKQ